MRNGSFRDSVGLAVLPARLKDEMQLLVEYILEGKDIRTNAGIEKHAAWVDEFRTEYQEITKENVMGILREEVGKAFVEVLEDAGVYKVTNEGREAFARFIYTL